MYIMSVPNVISLNCSFMAIGCPTEAGLLYLLMLSSLLYSKMFRIEIESIGF